MTNTNEDNKPYWERTDGKNTMYWKIGDEYSVNVLHDKLYKHFYEDMDTVSISVENGWIKFERTNESIEELKKWNRELNHGDLPPPMSLISKKDKQ